jgi:TrmH family RNA methyltransferase
LNLPLALPMQAVKMRGPMPSPKEISSTKNPWIQRFRAAAAGEEPDAMLVEGVRLVGEGLDGRHRVLAAAVSPRLREPALAQRLREVADEFAECTDAVLERMSALESHQGVAALFRKPTWPESDLLRGDLSPFVVVAAGVRDPGNLGALLRTAEAAAATGFVAMAGGADPYREKAVRGSMGSVFRLPALHGLDSAAVIALAQRQRLQLVVAAGDGEQDHLAIDWRRPTLLVLGAEAAGAPEELRRAASARVRIEMKPPVDSLNVAVAAGVMLFEARRQRR